MGVSTDAMLVYGISLESPESKTYPWEGYGESDNYCEQFTDWLAEQFEGKVFHVELVLHCSCDCPEYFLGKKLIQVYRGYPKEVRSQLLDDDSFPQLSEEIKLICKKAGISEEGEPKIFLASLWC